ncbi:MAG: hypothetical protein ACR2J3_10025 [Aridibacter sp.]
MNKKLEKKISELEAEIIKNHQHDTELFKKLNAAQSDLGILDNGRPFSPFLRPCFLTRKKYNEISHAAETLAQAFERMTFAAFENEEIMRELDLTETEERLARIDPKYKGVCHSSRLDTFLHGDDFKFLEYNAETPAGIIDQMQIEKVLFQIPEVVDFLENNKHFSPKPHEKLLDALVEGYKDFGGEKKNPNIAIVDWKDVATASEFVVLKEYFESKGHKCSIIDPHDLEYNGEFLHVGDFEIDIFYKRVLIHEFLEKFGEDNPLVNAYRDGNIFMANSFRTKIPHKKASFAIASDERFQDIFTGEQTEIIKKHIPWTRRVREMKTKDFDGNEIDLIEHIRKNRDEFILKPNDDYGGHGIVFGWESTESEWETAIEKALSESFVVQKKVEIEKIDFPAYDEEKIFTEKLLVDFDPFLFRGKVEGGLVRLSTSSLVNVAAGGGETALVVID